MESVEDQLGATVATGVPGAVAVAVETGERVEAAVGFADLRTGEALPIEVRLRLRGAVTTSIGSSAVGGKEFLRRDGSDLSRAHGWRKNR
jgi:hypothetical protein